MTTQPEQLDLLVHTPPERVPEDEEPTEIMATLRKLLAHGEAPRDTVLSLLAAALGYQRISAKLRSPGASIRPLSIPPIDQPVRPASMRGRRRDVQCEPRPEA